MTMDPSGAGRLGGDRLDLHNSNVDQLAAGAGYCGMIDLTTGRICILSFRHAGPCQLVPRPLAGTGRQER